jgi:competence protein ComGC
MGTLKMVIIIVVLLTMPAMAKSRRESIEERGKELVRLQQDLQEMQDLQEEQQKAQEEQSRLQREFLNEMMKQNDPYYLPRIYDPTKYGGTPNPLYP